MSQTLSKRECSARLLYRPEYQLYDFGPRHPMRPERLRTSLDCSSGWASDAIRIIRILDGTFRHAFNPAGGLHQALRGRASGFCIYNDAAIAIAAALQEREARVLYLDFDAHHGDGVQAAFYDEPRVLSSRFSGIGFLEELGEGLGRGYSLSLPVEAFTEDDSWLDSLELLLEPITEWFGPDVIVSQHGCDSHAWAVCRASAAGAWARTPLCARALAATGRWWL